MVGANGIKGYRTDAERFAVVTVIRYYWRGEIQQMTKFVGSNCGTERKVLLFLF